MTREELLRANDDTHARLIALIDRAPEARLTAAGPGDGWSVRDHLIHLADWQSYMADLLAGTAETRRFDEAAMNAHNDRLAVAGQTTSLAEARAALERSSGALRAQVERLDEARLAAPTPYGTSGDPLWDQIGGNAFEHYQEHLEAIEAALR